MTGSLREGVELALAVGVGIVVGVGLRRWKGDAFRSNVRTQLATQVGTAIGYFLVADRDDRSADDPMESA